MKRRRGLKAGKLPRLEINTEAILRVCENSRSKYVTYSSDLEDTGYVCSDDEVLILTANGGYLRIREEDIKTIVEELRFVGECQSIRRRA